MMWKPESTNITSPVTPRPRSLARKTAASATSEGSGRRRGWAGDRGHGIGAHFLSEQIARARCFDEGAVQVLTICECDAVDDDVELLDGLAETGEVLVFGDVAIEDALGSEIGAELLDRFLQ